MGGQTTGLPNRPPQKKTPPKHMISCRCNIVNSDSPLPLPDQETRTCGRARSERPPSRGACTVTPPCKLGAQRDVKAPGEGRKRARTQPSGRPTQRVGPPAPAAHLPTTSAQGRRMLGGRKTACRRYAGKNPGPGGGSGGAAAATFPIIARRSRTWAQTLATAAGVAGSLATAKTGHDARRASCVRSRIVT